MKKIWILALCLLLALTLAACVSEGEPQVTTTPTETETEETTAIESTQAPTEPTEPDPTEQTQLPTADPSDWESDIDFSIFETAPEQFPTEGQQPSVTEPEETTPVADKENFNPYIVTP